jgi:hypothetical protein
MRHVIETGVSNKRYAIDVVSRRVGSVADNFQCRMLAGGNNLPKIPAHPSLS